MSTGNALAAESSPYLLQHAGNPVHWKPWGPAAFEEARQRDIPVFLSVGYATCHWCHVMERESFESEAIARIMNEHFVCVKVDREERPEVDEPYMLATQLMTGSGGWPMSVFLEPQQLRPFWCATYLPPAPRHGMSSFPETLEAIARAWRERRGEILEQAEALASAVRENMRPAPPAPVGPQQVGAAVESLLRMFDRTHGGFGSAPKFPQPSFVELLLEARDRVDEGPRRAIDEAARRTLDRMAVGGLRDHVGGGFHRYCVDATWTVPHFEKMLYDNALLAGLYARASAVYSDAFYAEVARDTLRSIAREMTSRPPHGGFYCAQDADTGGHEGATYLWTEARLREALPPVEADLAIRLYGVDRGPNFRDPHHADDEPANVLRLDDRPEVLAAGLSLPADELAARLVAINGRLLAVRAQREQPGLDDKVLVAWNGMMIAAMARCAESLGAPDLLGPAAAAAEFIERELHEAGGLRRTWRDGRLGPAGTLEDYAWLLAGLVALARARAGAPRPDSARTFDDARALLDRCEQLYQEAAARFEDPQHPGLFYDALEGEFFVRVRSTYDGATPCASSAMLGALVDLAEMEASGDAGSSGGEPAGDWGARARRALAALSGAIAGNPLATVNATRHLLRMLRLDPGIGEPAVGAAAQAPEPAPAAQPAAAPADFTPIEIYADRERVSLGADEPAELNLVLRIAPGHYIYAPETRPEGRGDAATSPLRVHLIRGAGVDVYFDAPEGEALAEPAGARALTGEIELRVALARAGELVGKPLLGVTFQACTESACLAPTTVELDVAIDVTG
jgi:uncharacterized protein YyaL (SSP411 family)